MFKSKFSSRHLDPLEFIHDEPATPDLPSSLSSNPSLHFLEGGILSTTLLVDARRRIGWTIEHDAVEAIFRFLLNWARAAYLPFKADNKLVSRVQDLE